MIKRCKKTLCRFAQRTLGAEETRFEDSRHVLFFNAVVKHTVLPVGSHKEKYNDQS